MEEDSVVEEAGTTGKIEEKLNLASVLNSGKIWINSSFFRRFLDSLFLYFLALYFSISNNKDKKITPQSPSSSSLPLKKKR